MRRVEGRADDKPGGTATGVGRRKGVDMIRTLDMKETTKHFFVLILNLSDGEGSADAVTMHASLHPFVAVFSATVDYGLVPRVAGTRTLAPLCA